MLGHFYSLIGREGKLTVPVIGGEGKLPVPDQGKYSTAWLSASNSVPITQVEENAVLTNYRPQSDHSQQTSTFVLLKEHQ